MFRIPIPLSLISFQGSSLTALLRLIDRPLRLGLQHRELIVMLSENEKLSYLRYV